MKLTCAPQLVFFTNPSGLTGFVWLPIKNGDNVIVGPLQELDPAKY